MTAQQHKPSYPGKARLLALGLILSFVLGFSLPQPKPEIWAKGKKQHFRLDFHNAKLSEFLKTMSELLGANILVDNKVRGRVTIVSPKKIPISQGYMVLKTVLNQYGFMPIRKGGIIRVVRTKEAIKMDNILRVTPDLEKFDAKEFKKTNKTATHLVVLRNSLANDLRGVLRNLASKNTKIINYRKGNALIFVGETTEVLHLISVAQELDKRSRVADIESMQRNIHIYHLQNANAEELAPVLARLTFQKPPDDDEKDKKDKKKKSNIRQLKQRLQNKKNKKNDVKVDIIANKETNSLIITAPHAVYRQVRSIIQQLDRMRSQVLVEALIVEVSGDDSWGAGIEWRHGQNVSKELGTEDTSSVASSGSSLSSELATSGGSLPGLTLGLLKGKLTDNEGNIQIPSVYAFLNYYSRDQDVNVLSTPQIMVTNNQEAEINVGQQVPILSNMRVTDQDSTIRSYDLKDVGIKLKITPHINQNDYVTLDVYQEVKSLQGDTTALVDVPPIISNKDLKTKVTVKDRQTIVIGGLVSAQRTDIERKTPILGDIPILGWLFKRSTQTQTKTNLLVFITPYLIKDPSDMRDITNNKRLQIENLRKLYKWREDE